MCSASPAVSVRLPANTGSRARGFTLIEIMVVVVILAILAALIVPRVMSRPDEAPQPVPGGVLIQFSHRLRLIGM